MAYMRNDRVALDRPAVSDEPQNRWGRDSLDNGFSQTFSIGFSSGA
jgi:hypothetical protein